MQDMLQGKQSNTCSAADAGKLLKLYWRLENGVEYKEKKFTMVVYRINEAEFSVLSVIKLELKEIVEVSVEGDKVVIRNLKV